MAYSIVWPGSLPQDVNEDFQEDGGVNVLSTPMDSGPAKTRRRNKAVRVLDVSMDMSTAQVATFDSFVENTLMGVKRFGFPHPRTGVLTESRIRGQENGKHYSLSYRGFDTYAVSFTLEVLP